MARIRSVKPEFFAHEELFDAEVKSGLPLRIAFIGLWCQADREGRFRWRPKSLKAGVLPFDDLDFADVMRALAEGGFIRQYEVDGELFGVVVKFAKHQHPHVREPVSQLPEPPRLTRAGTEEHRASTGPGSAEHQFGPLDLVSGSGKGREGKEIKDTSPAKRARAYPPGFLSAWDAYPHHGTRSAKSKAAAVWERRGLEKHAAMVLRWIGEAKVSDDWTKDSGQFIPGMQVWLGGHDFAEEPTVERERHRPFRLGARREPAIPTPCEHCPHDSRRHELRADTTWPCCEPGCECGYFVAAETVAANERG